MLFSDVLVAAIPYLIIALYIVGTYYLVKLIVYITQLPKKLTDLESRIKKLEQKEK